MIQYRTNPGMSDRHSQIGKTEEEIILKLWIDSRKTLDDFKTRKSSLDKLSSHFNAGTFPSNLKYLDYKPNQFPKSFSADIKNAHILSMTQQHQQLKISTLTSMIQAYQADLQLLEAEIERIFGEEYISGVLEHLFKIAVNDCAELKSNVRVALNTKKAIFLNDKINFNSVRTDNTIVMDTNVSEDSLSSSQFVEAPLTQLSPTEPEDNLRSPPHKRRSPSHFPIVNDFQQNDMLRAIQQIADQVSSLQLKFDNQLKNVTGPGPAQGPWTGDQRDGRRNLSRSNRSNSNNSNRNSLNSNRDSHDPSRRPWHQHQSYQEHRSRSRTRRSESPRQSDSNLHMYNNYNRSKSPKVHSRPPQRGGDFNRGGGKFQGRGSNGRRF